jgi:flagellar biogenesis protein FliO
MSTICVARAPETSLNPGHEQQGTKGGERSSARDSFPAAQALYRVLVRCWAVTLKVLAAQRPDKKYLRVCESVSLGDKRFVAVIQAGEERFLVGGAANSIAMLTRLSEPSPTFSAAMKDRANVGTDIQ